MSVHSAQTGSVGSSDSVATGSIGSSTLDLVERSGDAFELVAVTASSNCAKLAEIARQYRAKRAVIADETQYGELKDRLAGTGCEVAAGPAALVEAARMDCDLHIAAIVGCAGLEPTMAAVEDGRTIGLANKESLVTAGALLRVTASLKLIDYTMGIEIAGFVWGGAFLLFLIGYGPVLWKPRLGETR